MKNFDFDGLGFWLFLIVIAICTTILEAMDKL